MKLFDSLMAAKAALKAKAAYMNGTLDAEDRLWRDYAKARETLNAFATPTDFIEIARALDSARNDALDEAINEVRRYSKIWAREEYRTKVMPSISESFVNAANSLAVCITALKTKDQ